MTIPFTRYEVLALMRELPENHWIKEKLNDEDMTTDEPLVPLTGPGAPKKPDYYNFGSKPVPNYEKDFTINCDFDNGWGKNCRNTCVKGYHECLEHVNLECVMCGKPALFSCPVPLQFVCGSYLCADHKDSHVHTGW